MSRHAVAALADLRPGVPVRVVVDGIAVMVLRLGDDVYALADTCSHEDASLSEGEVYEEDREIECPLHGSTFDLETGAALCLPATAPVAVYDASVDADGSVWVERSEVPR